MSIAVASLKQPLQGWRNLRRSTPTWKRGVLVSWPAVRDSVQRQPRRSAMNLKPLLVLTVLFLTACAGRTVKDDLPASDLDVLVANVHRTTAPTLLPNGKEYCLEDAATEDAQDDCAGDLEDAVYLANRKAARTRETVQGYVRAERLRRSPCGWWGRIFSARCKPASATGGGLRYSGD